jgi:ribosome-associated protein
MIQITDNIAIDEKEVQEEFIRSSGPGGQNINKVATAVQIRFDAANSPSLPDGVRQRLFTIAGKRINTEGMLVIVAKRYRTQKANREDAIERLVELISKAAQKPKVRRKTRATLTSKMRRLETKRRHALSKRLRQPVSEATDE